MQPEYINVSFWAKKENGRPSDERRHPISLLAALTSDDIVGVRLNQSLAPAMGALDLRHRVPRQGHGHGSQIFGFTHPHHHLVLGFRVYKCF